MSIGCLETSGKDLDLSHLDPSYELRSEGNLKVRKKLKFKSLQKIRLDDAVFLNVNLLFLKNHQIRRKQNEKDYNDVINTLCRTLKMFRKNKNR